MLRNSTKIVAVIGLLAAGLLQPAAASAIPTATATPAAAYSVSAIVAGGTISVQYLPNEQSPLAYEMDSANHMSWMRSYAVPVQTVTTTATANLSASDLSVNHFVYRTTSDAQKYDLPPNPDNMSSYHFMPGAQYITSHGDLSLVGGQTIGVICRALSGQLLAVFQTYVAGATHTFAAWLSAAEWAHASLTGGYLANC